MFKDFGTLHRRRPVAVALAAAAAVSGAFALAISHDASAAGTTVGQTTTFDPGDINELYTVPAGTCEVRITAQGAAGGDGNHSALATAPLGGLGGIATGTFSVAGGDSLYVSVGTRGVVMPATGSGAGVNGGGANGGGGASDVRTSTNVTDRIIAAGGGGGASLFNDGGNGGHPNGGDGTTGDRTGPGVALVGSGATQTGPGVGGFMDGVGEVGGDGLSYIDSGGGGGGWYGGSSGTRRGDQSGAGGGGSSHVRNTASDISYSTATTRNDGSVGITAIPCPPPVVIGESTSFGPGLINAQYVVPARVCKLEVVAEGAAGGDADYAIAALKPLGGRGAVVAGTIDVAAGQTFYVNTGTRGRTMPGVGNGAGLNGGGTYGGGGATDLRTGGSAVSNRILVAGGGGGAIASVIGNSADGGDGGYPNGADGGTSAPVPAATGGSQTAAGTNPLSAARDAVDGNGGNGSASAYDTYPGGGGGWFGGAGGFVIKDALGGAGGSSHASAAFTAVSHSVATKRTHGSARITPILCETSVVPVSPTNPTTPTTTTPQATPKAPAKITLVKKAKARAKAGSFIGYRIVVRNTGGKAATGVVVTDKLPRALSLDKVTIRSKAKRKRVSNRRFALRNGTLVWRLGTIRPGKAKVITVRTRIARNARGRVLNVARATSKNAGRATGRRVVRVRPDQTIVLPAVTG